MAALPCEFGLPAYSYYNWPDLYPVYVRGEAYLATHRGAEATTEFKKILAHRGLVLNEPTGVLAHLQLGALTCWQGISKRHGSLTQDFYPSGTRPMPISRCSSRPSQSMPRCHSANNVR